MFGNTRLEFLEWRLRKPRTQWRKEEWKEAAEWLARIVTDYEEKYICKRKRPAHRPKIQRGGLLPLPDVPQKKRRGRPSGPPFDGTASLIEDYRKKLIEQGRDATDKAAIEAFVRDYAKDTRRSFASVKAEIPRLQKQLSRYRKNKEKLR